MSDEESSSDEFYPSLDTLPVEVFLHICTFLNGKQIIESLKSVCQRFNVILSDDNLWKTWLKQRWPRLPTSEICHRGDDIVKQLVCIEVDQGLHLWSKKEVNVKKWICNSVHISTVDTVKLLKGGKLGISGSRDRSLALWDTSEQLVLVELKNNAHDGWIWDICPSPEPQQFYSCSWDSLVKLWTIDQQLLPVAAFKCKAAALTVASRPGLVATGLFTATVELFDPRTGSVGSYNSHHRSIMALAFLRDFLISASEDHTLSVWDIKAGKSFKSGIKVSSKGHPMTLSMNDGDLLFVGDTESKLHIFDTCEDSFKLIDTFDLGHKPRGGITSMWNNTGFILTGSKDASVRIHTATRPPYLITQLNSESGGITSVDFADSVLLTGCVDSGVEMWKPC